MIVECQKCGAPLTVVEGQRLVSCIYCGATSQVRSGLTAQQPAWQPPPPPPLVPSSSVQSSVTYVYRPDPSPPKAGGPVAAMVVAGVLVAFGGVVAALVAVRGAPFAARLNPRAPATVATIPIVAAMPVSRAIAATAGGPIRGGSVDTRCRGYLPVAPQFMLALTSVQRVRLTTDGPNDLTMALREPSGTYRCDDDGGEGSNPLLDVTLGPGVYPVWVGTFRQNTTASFNLLVQSGTATAQPFGASVTTNAAPTLGTVALAGPTSVATRVGVAGGPVDASGMGSGCRGHLPAAPHVVVRTTDYRSVVLVTAGSTDLTMVVRDATGAMHCDDDSGGSRQPRVTATLPPGDHQVWIGTYSANQTGAFTLSVQSASAGSASPLGVALSPTSPPTLSTLDLDRLTTTTLRGVVAGTLEARAITPGCVGYVSAAPQLRLVSRTPRHVSITATSSTDLTLLARGPSGDMVCADDSNGSSNPTLEADIAAGETTVWIGSYTPSRRAPFRVQVTASAPVAAAVK